jgi:hypothetical protein
MGLDGPAARHQAVAAYLSLVAFHAAHVLEEVFGRFVALHRFGLAAFLAANWVLFCVPLFIFYFWLAGRRWARTMAMVYAGVMVLNGLGHNAMTLATGRYFDGYAGGFSGLGLIVAGAFLIRALRPEKPGQGD